MLCTRHHKPTTKEKHHGKVQPQQTRHREAL